MKVCSPQWGDGCLRWCEIMAGTSNREVGRSGLAVCDFRLLRVLFQPIVSSWTQRSRNVPECCSGSLPGLLFEPEHKLVNFLIFLHKFKQCSRDMPLRSGPLRRLNDDCRLSLTFPELDLGLGFFAKSQFSLCARSFVCEFHRN